VDRGHPRRLRIVDGLTGRVQVVTPDSPGIKGGRAGSQFCQGVISADFDADGYADVAGQAYGSIQVVYGGPSGLTSRDQVLRWIGGCRSLVCSGRCWPAVTSTDGFAYALFDAVFGEDKLLVDNDTVLTVADLDRDGHVDLALAAPRMRIGRVPAGGAVVVVYGGPRGLDFGRSRLWSQGTRKIKGVPVRQDSFGDGVLRIADIGRGKRPDLLVLTRHDKERTGRKARTVQSLNVLFSGRYGVTTSDQRWISAQSDGS
jgi:hypothetical protein